MSQAKVPRRFSAVSEDDGGFRILCPFHMAPDRSWKVSLCHHKPDSRTSLSYLQKNRIPFLFLECLESSLTPNGLCHWLCCPGCILKTRSRGVVSCSSLDPQPIFFEWLWTFTQILYQLSQLHLRYLCLELKQAVHQHHSGQCPPSLHLHD